MDGQALVDLTIAKVVPITDASAQANVNSAFVLAAVNEAYHTVERTALWKWSEAETTFATVANQAEYVESTIAADMLTVQHIWDDTAQGDLRFLDERQRYHSAGLSVTGVPHSWSRWNGNIILHPTPSGVRTLTVRYYAGWADLTLGTEPVFPDIYHDMLTDHAAGVLALRLPPLEGRYLPGSRAEPHRQQFFAKLQQMVNDPRSGVTMDEIRNHDWDEYVALSQDW